MDADDDTVYLKPSDVAKLERRFDAKAILSHIDADSYAQLRALIDSDEI